MASEVKLEMMKKEPGQDTGFQWGMMPKQELSAGQLTRSMLEMRKPKPHQDLDTDFQWGMMPKQELSGQFTRSMMEMRKPKPHELLHPPALYSQKKEEATCREIIIPRCPFTIHTIKLIKYIRQVQDLISVLESRDFTTYGYSSMITQLLQPPAFDSEGSESSSRKSAIFDSHQQKAKFIFSAPDLNSNFRSGLGQGDFSHMDERTASRILKRSVATVAAHAGFEESTSSALDVLTGAVEAFMTSFSNSLREGLDSEAETGRTAFYDTLDQAVHESGLSGIEDIRSFYRNAIVHRHKNLQKQAAKLSKTLQSLKYPKPDEMKTPPGQETMQTSSYGKWTPVAGMSSSPFFADGLLDAASGTSPWMIQAVKLEPRQSKSYISVGSSSHSVKSEYGDSSTHGIDVFNAGAVNDPFTCNDQQTLYGAADDFRHMSK